MKDKGDGDNILLRYNTGKVQWHLMDFEAFEPMIRVLEGGAGKYAPNNWKKPANRAELLDSLTRHLVALNKNDGIFPEPNTEIDHESGIAHMAHIACNVMFYLRHLMDGTWTDLKQNPYPNNGFHEAFAENEQYWRNLLEQQDRERNG